MKRVFGVPFVYAVVVALAARYAGVVPPAESTLMQTLELVGNASIPVMLLILGVQLAGVDIEGTLRPVGAAGALRLLLAPLVASAVTTFGAIPDREYMPRLRRAYTALARLVCTDQPQVCRAVSWLFSNRLAPLIQAAFESSSGGVGSEESCDSAR
jgi:predicted permease